MSELGRLGRLLPDALLVVTLEGVVSEANPSAARILEHDCSDLRGKRLSDFLDPVNAGRLPAYLRQCARSGQLVPGPVRVVTRGCDARDYRLEGAGLGPAAGGAILLRLRTLESATHRFRLLTEKIEELAAEVSHRRRAESLLEGELQVLQHMVTAASLDQVLEELVELARSHGSERMLPSIVLASEDGQILVHGAAPVLPPAYGCEFEPASRSETTGSGPSPAFSGKPLLSRDIETDPRWKDHKDIAREHGLRACWSTPIPSRQGQVLGTFVMYYRVPMEPPAVDRRVAAVASRIASIAIERRREEARVEQLLSSERSARAEAEAANRAKDEFLALISHELRNPLNAMLGWTRLLQMENLDQETFQQGIETIERNAELQGQLIADVLDFARVSSGNLKLDLRPVRIDEIVEEAVGSLLPDAENAGLRLDLHCDPVESASCDPVRIHQVVTNLVSNAIKFTPSGGQVTVRICQDGDSAVITVADTGQGIAPAFLPYVFDKFRQADGSLSRPHSGLGLGLSVARRIVEMHEGRLSAASGGEGKGATFTVQLPLRRAATQSEPQPHAHADVSGLRVLVVDDEPDARELFAAILGHRGARPTLAASASEAVAALDAGPTGEPATAFDVMVSDIAMSGTDGYALMRAVRGRRDANAGIPAAALTAHARDSDREQAFAAGYDRHLSKPVDPDLLLRVIAELARSRQ